MFISSNRKVEQYDKDNDIEKQQRTVKWKRRWRRYRANKSKLKITKTKIYAILMIAVIVTMSVCFSIILFAGLRNDSIKPLLANGDHHIEEMLSTFSAHPLHSSYFKFGIWSSIMMTTNHLIAVVVAFWYDFITRVLPGDNICAAADKAEFLHFTQENNHVFHELIQAKQNATIAIASFYDGGTLRAQDDAFKAMCNHKEYAEMHHYDYVNMYSANHIAIQQMNPLAGKVYTSMLIE